MTEQILLISTKSRVEAVRVRREAKAAGKTVKMFRTERVYTQPGRGLTVSINYTANP
jgi:hypothetical protein